MRIPRSTKADCVGSSSSSSCSSVLPLTLPASDPKVVPEYSFNPWRWEKFGSSGVHLFEGLLVRERKDVFVTPSDRAVVPCGVAPKQSTDSIHGGTACLRNCQSVKENHQLLNIKHFTYIDFDSRVPLLPHLAEPVFHEKQFQNIDSLVIHGVEIESSNQAAAACLASCWSACLAVCLAACLRDCQSVRRKDWSLKIKHFTCIDSRTRILLLPEPVFYENLKLL